MLDCDWLTDCICNLIGWKQWTGTVGKSQESLYKRWFLVGWLVGKRRKTYHVHVCVLCCCILRWLCRAKTHPRGTSGVRLWTCIIISIQFNFSLNNKHILIDNKPVYLSSFSDKNINFINNLLECLGNFKSWNVLKTEFKLADSLHFSWMKLINAIPLNWKTIIKHNCSVQGCYS